MTEMKTMREEMAAIATEARNKLAEVTDETPEDRAAEIEREFDAMMADHDKLAARVERVGHRVGNCFRCVCIVGHRNCIRNARSDFVMACVHVA